MAGVLFFDTETTGLPDWRAPSDAPQQPYIVQVAAMLNNEERKPMRRILSLIKPDGWIITDELTKIHGITTEMCEAEGRPLSGVLRELLDMMAEADVIVGHNVSFDMRMVRIATKRARIEVPEYQTFCTMKKSADIVNMAPTFNMVAAGLDKPKPPKLTEAYQHFFNETFEAHNAMYDMEACARIYYHLKDQGV